MSTIIRVKRRLDEEPSEVIVLSCKRAKLETEKAQENQSDVTTLFKLAGTLNNQEEDIFKHIKPATSTTDSQETYKKHLTNITEKIRNDTAAQSKNNRYKIVNYYRSKANADSPVKNEVMVVDLEDNVTQTAGKDLQSETELTKYVYDLYYTNSDDFDEANLDDYISAYPLSDELVYGSARDNGYNDTDNDDSDDSNNEANWRNDYPDESDMESITEDDMVQAVRKCTLEDQLSSDDGEEGFVYSIDSEAAGFEEDIDLTDVQRYGERYARFKSKYKKTEESSSNQENVYYGDIDENEYYY